MKVLDLNWFSFLILMSPQWHRISGTVQPGYRVASGTSDRSPYPKGTIEMQMPFFRELGLDLSPYFLGTLNVAIAPFRFEMKLPKYTFRKIRWIFRFLLVV